MQRIDLVTVSALDDQRVDLALSNRPQHVLGFGEAGAQRLGLFVTVGVGVIMALLRVGERETRSSPSSTRRGSTCRR